MRPLLYFVVIQALISFNLAAQPKDTLQTQPRDIKLGTVQVEGSPNAFNGIGRLPETTLTGLGATKKTEIIYLDKLNLNTAVNTTRQVFAKVPGIQIWENDGSGQQVGVAARGLSPNRSWEFNTRQNGYDISSDPLGYPEAYYNPPMDMVERIEVVRGAASLQYGSQFGGLLNYILKRAPADKKFALTTQHTGGSYGLYNQFTSLGGTTGRISYYAAGHFRRADGWRQYSWYETGTGYGRMSWLATPRLQLSIEHTSHQLLQRLPAGLTEARFAADPQAGYRPRNWMRITWNMPAFTLEYQLTDSIALHVKAFALLGDRSSVANTAALTDANLFEDPTSTRTVVKDQYRNAGVEARLGMGYRAIGQAQRVVAGLRYFTSNTSRIQGTGTATYDADFSTTGILARDQYFGTQHAAIFIENLLRITDRLILTQGLRYETMRNTAASTFNGAEQPTEARTRNLLLAGAGAEYHLGAGHAELYASINQAYRPLLFSDLFPANVNQTTDGTLRDATGCNAELGYRGRWSSYLNWDVSLFLLQYNNRAGTAAIVPAVGPVNTLLTNAGNSTHRGVEAFVECNILSLISPTSKWSLSVFNSTGYTDAKYTAGPREGNRVEHAPNWLVRSGITLGYHAYSLTLNHQHVSSAFSDAANTPSTANGTNGYLPAYQVLDLSFVAPLNKTVQFSGGANNLMNHSYYTRRAGGFPGPGIVPADGRMLFLGVQAKI